MNKLRSKTNHWPKALGISLLLLISAVSFRHGFAADESVASAQVTSVPPISYRLEDVEISLMRTGCYGSCSSYEVTIFGDGRIVYEGKRFVRIEGERRSVIDKSAVLGVLRRLYEIYFFDMRDGYEAAPDIFEQDGVVTAGQVRVTDIPSQTVSVRLGAYEKTIHHRIGGPPDLKTLIELIDEVADSKRWIE